ncbi:hypothetical protein [Polaromonas sp.]|uniref:hypothetical protein n=1 Tax=Polaromonas sp. TaxID=1869339 RepID=UPI003BB796F1
MADILATSLPSLDGVPIQLGSLTYILPPCSLGTLRRHAKGIDAFAKMGAGFALSESAVDTILAVVLEALRRNYPTIEADFVADNIGVDQIMPTFQAAMDVSGLMRKAAASASSTAAGEGGTLGESTGTALPPTS